MGGPGGAVHVGRCAPGHAGKYFHGGRVLYGDPLAGRAGDPFAVDVQMFKIHHRHLLYCLFFYCKKF